MMTLQLSDFEYRLLLDLVYTGNWIINSMRDDDRIEEYDHVQEKIFSACLGTKLSPVVQEADDRAFPSSDYIGGGIHEVIADYEDVAFFDILAEELSLRDMRLEDHETNVVNVREEELEERMDGYAKEFEANGVDRLMVVEEEVN